MTEAGDLMVGDQLEVFQIQTNDDLRLENITVNERGLHLIVITHSGRGAYGSVFLCWIVEGRELVALKMFPDVPAGQDYGWLLIINEYGVRIRILVPHFITVVLMSSVMF
jgi:hypothetical protein